MTYQWISVIFDLLPTVNFLTYHNHSKGRNVEVRTPVRGRARYDPSILSLSFGCQNFLVSGFLGVVDFHFLKTAREYFDLFGY